MHHPNAAPVDGFSRHSVLLRMEYNGTVLSRGSGLLAQTPDQKVFLVTALHNLSGREPDGTCKDRDLAIPNWVNILGWGLQDLRFPLYEGQNEPGANTPLFKEHPDGPAIDVSVLAVPFPNEPGRFLHPSFLMPDRHHAHVVLEVTQLCFVVGYPEGYSVPAGPGSISPIWKTGHIASEPSYYVDGQPKILIDAATGPGMSGSPVYVREGKNRRLLGIYAGRIGKIGQDGRPESPSELGYVFTPEAIAPMLSST